MATLINGNGNLAIYAQQDADWYAALMGGQTVITAVGNQFAYELLASNTIGVKDGVIITSEGRRIQLDANAIDSFDIPTGAQGTTNYYIIGYHLVTGNQSEQTCETFVQLMENGTDTIPEGSFRDGDDEVFISLYRVEQDDLTIGTITLLLPQLSGSFQSQITELNNDLTDYSVNTPLRNVTYYNGKLYQITNAGQRGSEIIMAKQFLNYKTPLKALEQQIEWTATADCMLKGSIWGINNTLLIDDTQIFDGCGSSGRHVEFEDLPIKMGQKVKAYSNTNQGACLINAYAFI